MQERNVLSKWILIVDYLPIDDLNQLEEIEAAIVVQGLVQGNRHNEVSQHFREGQLHNWKIILICRAILHESLKIVLVGFVSIPEGKATQQ